MKGMKGKFLKKLKSVKSIGYLKQDLILQATTPDGFVHNLLSKSKNFKIPTQFIESRKKGDGKDSEKRKQGEVREVEGVDVVELMKDFEEVEEEIMVDDDKENVAGNCEKRVVGLNVGSPLLEIGNVGFKKPDFGSGSGSCFDPHLLAVFEQAVMEVKDEENERRGRVKEDVEEIRPLKARRISDIENPLIEFEEKCPPGGENKVILYTTGLRGIRKTFEDCASIRFLLQTFRVSYFERDVSMHLEFKEELWRILGEKVVPPKLFIKGRYIGGAEMVVMLHEQGKLRRLFDGVLVDGLEGVCEVCVGVRFLICIVCNGSRRVFVRRDDKVKQCEECNENGLISCPICC
ncbi:Glutaredoxin domain-containing protein [Heracleum sosnowskyi]|uniref:Glutaredoxin domain-containing protein n=1 Tax=Heracleum sosnowskyi TaxID=360622 RepID=A0AAD8N4S4_9APIA|nr:Glutaredoxin domain-containing protein [Heracleum sosnowskyi]